MGSAINNAIARVAGLLAIAAFGAILAARYSAALDASRAAHLGPRARAFLAEARSRPLDTAVPAAAGADARAVEAMLVDASDSALHTGLLWMAGLLVTGGLISAAGIRNRAGRPDRAGR